MRAVPRGLREGAYAMGATKFEVVRKVVLPAAISGIMASIILAMSRAVGETMAVVLAVGTFPQFSFNPLESVQTMTAFIVQIVQGETSQGSIQFLSLFAVAMVLFVMTFALNLAERLVRPALPDDLLMASATAAPTRRRRGSSRTLMRRKLNGTLFYGACLLAIAILILALIALLLNVLVVGLPWLNLDFITGMPSRRPAQAGILPALIGSIQLAIIVARDHVPDRHRRRRLPRRVRARQSPHPAAPDEHQQPGRRAVDHLRHLRPGDLRPAARPRSGPVLRRGDPRPASSCRSSSSPASRPSRPCPQAQREGAYALGASRWQMVRGSVLPAAAPGIMTGIILAMARAIGEAAPLVVVGAATFVTSLPQPFEGGFTVLPIQIFNWAQRPQEDFQGIAAATIIVILVLIFILNLLALIVRARLSRHIQW